MAGQFNEPSTNTAAVNTNVVIDLAAVSGLRRSIKQIAWSHDADPATATRLTVESPAGTVLWDLDVTKGGPGVHDFPNNGIPGAEGQVLRTKLTISNTSGAIGTLNILEGNG